MALGCPSPSAPRLAVPHPIPRSAVSCRDVCGGRLGSRVGLVVAFEFLCKPSSSRRPKTFRANTLPWPAFSPPLFWRGRSIAIRGVMVIEEVDGGDGLMQV
jgi:hypothetical protein